MIIPLTTDHNIVVSRSGCRNTVMQMIAEKSVNCSLMSLPPSPGSDLPTCGPLEGLALMYILKEQGDLVVQNPAIRNKFERNLMEKCPYECERKYWRSEVISSEVEEKVDLRGINKVVFKYFLGGITVWSREEGYFHH